jgi:hypothetical protein
MNNEKHATFSGVPAQIDRNAGGKFTATAAIWKALLSS